MPVKHIQEAVRAESRQSKVYKEFFVMKRDNVRNGTCPVCSYQLHESIDFSLADKIYVYYCAMCDIWFQYNDKTKQFEQEEKR